jgi:hypothetical protein
MYITNIRHLSDASAKMSEEMPAEVRELFELLTLVIDSTTRTLPDTLTTTDVRCTEKGCDGLIKSALRPDTGEIHWYCPVCEKEGLINNWQGTKWDQRSINNP